MYILMSYRLYARFGDKGGGVNGRLIKCFQMLFDGKKETDARTREMQFLQR
jgi:hypothetical protein